MGVYYILALIFHLAELIFAAIVTGVCGAYLDSITNASNQGRFIYTEVVAGLSILLAIICLAMTIQHVFVHWGVHIFISILWWIAFGILVDLINGRCGYVFNWHGMTLEGKETCNRWKAIVAFAFLSALFWLVSAIIEFVSLRWGDRTVTVSRGKLFRRRGVV